MFQTHCVLFPTIHLNFFLFLIGLFFFYFSVLIVLLSLNGVFYRVTVFNSDEFWCIMFFTFTAHAIDVLPKSSLLNQYHKYFLLFFSKYFTIVFHFILKHMIGFDVFLLYTLWGINCFIFYMWMFYHSVICYTDFFLFFKFPLYIYQKLSSHIWSGLFQGSLFCSIDLNVIPFTYNILSWLLKFYSKSWRYCVSPAGLFHLLQNVLVILFSLSLHVNFIICFSIPLKHPSRILTGNYFCCCYCFVFWPRHMACRIWVPCSEMEPVPLAEY